MDAGDLNALDRWLNEFLQDIFLHLVIVELLPQIIAKYVDPNQVVKDVFHAA